jgi:ferredoxin
MLNIRTAMSPPPRVVTEACIQCKYTDCVDVCPVDAFREGPNFLVIDPDVCTGCGKCDRECPIPAIYPEDQIPTDQLYVIALNERLARQWPPITKRREALPQAYEWSDVPDKKKYLIETNPTSCPSCGAELKGSINRCSSCSHSFLPNLPAMPKPQAATTPTKPYSASGGKWRVFLLLAVIIVALGSYLIFGRS